MDRLHPLSQVILALAILGLACGAPRSRPFGGEIEREVLAAIESGDQSFDHNQWERLLATGTKAGRVDYVLFQERRERLDQYLERVAKVDLESLDADNLMALLINAYNALTVRTILDHPTVSSIKEIDGVWTEITHRVGGYDLTLDQIEHNLLRPYFKDPRIHFVVNCASTSCAPLPIFAYHAAQIEAQLDRQTRKFLEDPANVRVEDGVLYVSSYFDWYGDDFVKEDWEPRADTFALFIADHIRYTRPDVALFIDQAEGRPPVQFLDYDWSLNALRPPDPSLGGAEAEGSAGE